MIANNPAMFNGDAEVSSFFTQPATLPGYQMQADRPPQRHPPRNQGARRIPGNDFAAYRWGDTVDTPQSAFLTRPFVTREQQTMGSMATADTLYAMDDPVQQGIENWNALAPMARLLSAGDVHGPVRPGLRALRGAPAPDPGRPAPADAARPFGPAVLRSPGPNVAGISTLNEQDLASPAATAWPEPIDTYTVENPRPITRAESNTGAVVVAGDATGLQAMAGSGSGHDQRPLLLGHPGHQPGPAAPAPGQGGRPRGHRHQPQAGLPLGHPHRQLRRHRDPGAPPRRRPI